MRESGVEHDDDSSIDIELDALPSTAALMSDIERQDPLYSPQTPHTNHSISARREHESTLLSGSASPSHTQQHGRTAFLDGLRGIGAFMVYGSHHTPWAFGTLSPIRDGFGYQGHYLFGQLPGVRLLFTGGNAAVAIFFVLSGYVLSISYLRTMSRKGKSQGQSIQNNNATGSSNEKSETSIYRALCSAVVRRPFRLYIPMVAITFIFALTLQLPDWLRPTIQWPPPAPDFVAEMYRYVSWTLDLMNPFVVHDVLHPWYIYCPPAYTTAIEFQGSLFIYFILALFTFVPTPLVRTVIMIVLGSVLYIAYQWALALFLVGAILASNDLEGYDVSMLKSFSSRAKSLFYHFCFFLGIFLLSQPAGGAEDIERAYSTWSWYHLTYLTPSNYWNKEWWRFYNVPGAIFLVYAVLRISWVQNFLMRRPIRYLGRISFSFYLVHALLMWTIGDRIYRLFGIIAWEDTVTWWDNKLLIPDFGPAGFSSRFIVSQLFILPITLCVSELCTRWFDEPGVRFSRKVAIRLGLDTKR